MVRKYQEYIRNISSKEISDVILDIIKQIKDIVLNTDFGVFEYRDIPAAAYPLGVRLEQENGISYAIASPEKAICDMLYTQSPVYSTKALEDLLFDDLRIDEENFGRLNYQDMQCLAPRYRRRNLRLLSELLEKRC